MWIGKRVFPGTTQPAAALIGPETHSVQPARAQAPASPPAWLADHRPVSVLAFLCSCVPEGLWAEAKDGGARPAGARGSAANRGSGNRWGTRRTPASQNPSCALPKAFGGETQGAGVSLNLRNQVFSREGEDPS